MDRMSSLDSLFLHVEDGINHMHIGSCSVFEGPAPAFDDLVALFDSKLPLLVRYRQRVRFVPGDLGRPVWVDDPHFNLAYHVRHTALPAPGDDAALRRLVGRLMSQELDRERPLWETWIVEGLSGGRWAIVTKVHHCMVDGVSGNDLITLLLETNPKAKITPAPPWTPEPEPSAAELAFRAVAEMASSPAEQVRLLRAATRAPRRALSYLGDVADGLRSYSKVAAPATRLSIEGHIGPHRRWTWTSTTLADIKIVRKAFGGTVNDVVLTVIAGGFRDLLQSRGDPVDDVTLRTLVPVSVRAMDDHTANNQVSAIIAELPVGVADPVERLHSVRAQMEELKGSHQATAGMALTALGDMSPPTLFALAARTVASAARRLPQYSVNTVTTNVPGPPQALYALGRKLTDYLPYVPLSQGVRIGIAIVSYNGNMAFGITGDYDTMPDIDLMAERIEAGMAELIELAAAAG